MTLNEFESLNASIDVLNFTNSTNIDFFKRDLKRKYIDLHLQELCLRQRKKNFENFVEMLENRLTRILKQLERNRADKAYEAIQNLLFKLQKEANRQDFESCKELKKKELFEKIYEERDKEIAKKNIPLKEKSKLLQEMEQELKDIFGLRKD